MGSNFRVLHFAASTGGGAGIAAQRIHRSLRDRGIESRFCYGWGVPPDTSFEQLPWCRGSIWRYRSRPGFVALRAWQALASLGCPPQLPPFSLAWLGYPTPPPFVDDRTIIHLHWVGRILDLPSFLAKVPSDMPLIWTLHDMNPVTGGCHYTMGCERFRVDCRPCPQLPFRVGANLAARSQTAKRSALDGKNLHVVGNSRWIEAQARRSRVFRDARSFRTIYYGVETELFAPSAKAEARALFSLPTNAIVIGFGADALGDRWKGFPELCMALKSLRDLSVEMLTFGRMTTLLDRLPLPHHDLGFINDRSRLASAYAAMDLFVIPSLEEAFGQTALEAISCGVPVVGFHTGGIPETVRDGETGYTSATGDVAGLAQSIRRLLENPDERRRLGANARALAVREFSFRFQGEQYEALYREALAR